MTSHRSCTCRRARDRYFVIALMSPYMENFAILDCSGWRVTAVLPAG